MTAVRIQLAVLSLIVLLTFGLQAQEQTDLPDARAAVESFVTDALAGRQAEAVVRIEGGSSPESVRRVMWLRNIANRKSLTITDVVVAETDGVARSAEIVPRSEDDPKTAGRTGRIVFDLKLHGTNWLIKGMDFETSRDSDPYLEEFKDRPGAVEMPLRRKVPHVGNIPAIGNDQGGNTSVLTTVKVEQVDPVAVQTVLKELFGRKIAVAADGRQLFVSGPASQVDEVRSVLELVDGPQTDPMLGKLDIVRKPPGKLERLLKQFREQDRRSIEVARWLRQLKSTPVAPGKETQQQIKEVEQQLRDAVDDAFETRQQLQQAELAALRERLAKLEQQVRLRQRVRERIIKRRVEELAEPGVQWNSSKAGSSIGPRTVAQQQAVQSVAQNQKLAADGFNYRPLRLKVQVAFQEPRGAIIDWRGVAIASLPGRVASETGESQEFRLRNIPNRKGVTITGTFSVAPLRTNSKAFLDHNAIPFTITDEDIDQVLAGNFVTKVVYLPKPEFAELAIAGVDAVVSTRLDPGVDPVTVARHRGHILATLTLGNRTRTLPGPKPGTPNAAAQDAADNAILELEKSLIGANAILFFHLDACPQCQTIAPEFDRKTSEAGVPTIRIDVAKHPEIATRFRVTSTPTFVLLISGEERNRATDGAIDKMVATLKECWDEIYGIDVSTIGADVVGLRGFLLRSLAELQRERDTFQVEILQLELSAASIEEPVTRSGDLSDEQKKKRDEDEKQRLSKLKQLTDHIARLQKEIRPLDAQIRLLQQRLQALPRKQSSNDKRRKVLSPAERIRNSVVQVEAIVDAPPDSDGNTGSAHYLNGTVVSADGFIATVIGGEGPADASELKHIRTAIVYFLDGTSQKARIAAFDPETGVALLKVDANDLPFLTPGEEPVAVGRRLSLHVTSEVRNGNELQLSYWSAAVEVASDPKRRLPFFAVESQTGTGFGESNAGAAILSADGALQGILGTDIDDVILEVSGGSAVPRPTRRPTRGAVSAAVIRKLLHKVSAPGSVAAP